MDARNPLGPDSVAHVISQFRERTEHAYDRRADMRAGAVLSAVDGLWDELAAHGAAAPRPRPPQPCPQPCREDDHYLTITKWDGSLLRVEPPDRPQPAREGTYVVTPPGAARVSAASVVEIIPGERLTAMDDWRARQA